MPVVNGKHYKYTPAGIKAAKEKKARLKAMKEGYYMSVYDAILKEARGGKKGDKSKDKPQDKPDYTTDAREGDEGAGKKKGDKPDFTTKQRKGDKSKTHPGKKDFEEAYTPIFDAILGTLNEKKKKKKDDKWMQKADKSIERRGTEGKCTPMTKPGCTGRALALAKTFHKIAAKRKGK